MSEDQNFIERATAELANEVNLNKYRLLEGLSAKKGIYCFKIKEAKRKKSEKAEE